MSYFDDNENYIIYGSHGRGPSRNNPRRCKQPMPDNVGWISKQGTFVKINSAENGHLKNMLEKLKREGRSETLCNLIEIELIERGVKL